MWKLPYQTFLSTLLFNIAWKATADTYVTSMYKSNLASMKQTLIETVEPFS